MIPFNDLARQHQNLADPLSRACEQVFQRGWFVLGAEGTAFEEEFAKWLDVPFVVGCASGTDALSLALMAAGIEPGDEVITTALTAFPTITAIQSIGAVPVCVDVEPNTGLLDPRQLPLALSQRSKAIIPVHLYGRPCDLPSILAFAQEHNLGVVEDCAQSTGASISGRQSGGLGDFGCFSFYPTKNLGACGDAGAVSCRTSEHAAKLRALRNYGQSRRYFHDAVGINSRLDEIQAAILRIKLPYLCDWNQRRANLAEVYHRELPGSILFDWSPHGLSCHHLFPLRIEQRDLVQIRLQKEGIDSLIHYPLPVPEQISFTGRSTGHPNASAICAQLLSLPLYPELTDLEQKVVISSLLKIIKELQP